jgi:NADH-quinone oxidoreductase subunit J
MSFAQIVFLLSAALILAAATMVVTARNLVHAALWLIAALFGVAVLYALLEASFLAVAQVVIYIGAIAIMFIFAVMLTRRQMRDHGPALNDHWWTAAVIAAATFAGLLFALRGWNGLGDTVPQALGPVDPLMALGTALISPDAYVLPFEVASVLLLAALVGAVYVSINKK